MTLLAPLRHRPFRLLFFGQVVSNLGDWLNLLALVSLLLYRWNLGAGAWGAVLTAMTLPFAVVGPAAGVWVDRWPRKAVMIASDLARAVVVLGLVWAPNLVTVVALVALASLFSTFFLPAQQATIRATVPEEDLLAANGLSQLVDNGARMLGPALGGLLVVLGGPRAAFVVDGLSFLLSAAVLSRLPALATLPAAGPAHATRDEQRHFWRELREGLAHVTGRRLLAVTVGSTALAAFLIRATDTLGVPVYQALGVGEGLLGVSFGVLGVGYVAGAVLVGQWGGRLAPLSVLGLARVVVGGLLAILGVWVILALSGGVAIWLAAFPLRLLLGLGFAAMSVAFGTILQRETPAALMGRVSATATTLNTLVPLAAPLIATLLAGWWGLGTTFTALGAALALVGVVPMLLRVEAPEPAAATERGAT